MSANRDVSKKPSGGWTDPDDPPEWSDEMFERADLYVGETLIRRGRRPEDATKVTVALRLSAEVVARFRATGRGWHARIDRILKDWLAEHPDTH